MRKLLRHEFKLDHAVDEARASLAMVGDQLFGEVMRLARGTREKLRAIKVFDRHNGRVKAFIKKHNFYFQQKKAWLLESVTLNRGDEGSKAESAGGVRRAARAVCLVAGVLVLLQGCAMADQCADPGLSQELRKACVEMTQACRAMGCSVSLRGGA